MYNKKGNVFNIQRFSTSDGPGIRTVVFLKGCPLNCSWCHNPESKISTPQILYKKELCINCQKCVTICTEMRHSFENFHTYDRTRCLSCGNCAKECPSNALELCGKETTVEDVIEKVIRDIPFYEETSGGLTLSGGEPLMQYDFSLALLKSAKEKGIDTAIETSGFSKENLEELNKYVDLWLYDIKILDDTDHQKYTGVSNKIILENLYALDNIGANIILRCPIIPDINMTEKHFDSIAELANKLKNVKSIHLELYHPLGISKAEQLNQKQIYSNSNFLKAEDIAEYYDRLKNKTTAEVIII